MVDDRELRLIECSCEVLLSDRHTDCHGKTSAQRTCCCIDTSCVAVLRMTRCLRVHLTELLQILNGQAAYTKEMEQGVIKRRTVTAGKNETVSVDPFRILRVKGHFLAPNGVSHRSGTKRETRVTGIGLLNHVRGKNADSGDCIVFDLCTHTSIHSFS